MYLPLYRHVAHVPAVYWPMTAGLGAPKTDIGLKAFRALLCAQPDSLRSTREASRRGSVSELHVVTSPGAPCPSPQQLGCGIPVPSFVRLASRPLPGGFRNTDFGIVSQRHALATARPRRVAGETHSAAEWRALLASAPLRRTRGKGRIRGRRRCPGRLRGSLGFAGAGSHVGRGVLRGRVGRRGWRGGR